jgi:methylisocitrate lyase
MSEKRVSLKELVSKEQIFAPCIYDCFSADAAKDAGYKAALLSGGAVAGSLLGKPDMAFLNFEELLQVTQRVCHHTELPIIVDADDGYAESPAVVYYNTKRLIEAGAMALTIEDSTGIRGWERLIHNNFSKQNDLVSENAWLAKVKAAVEACEGTDCMVIARTAAKYTYGLEEACVRLNHAFDCGAHMALAVGIKTLADCEYMAEHLKGWKMYPDVAARNHCPDVELSDMKRCGFNLVTMHYMEKGALWGMIQYGVENLRNRTTVYSKWHDMNGYGKFSDKSSHSQADSMLEMEDRCFDNPGSKETK